jgi:hypothetical protein
MRISIAQISRRVPLGWWIRCERIWRCAEGEFGAAESRTPKLVVGDGRFRVLALRCGRLRAAEAKIVL